MKKPDLLAWLDNLGGTPVLAHVVPVGSSAVGINTDCDCICTECDDGHGSGQCDCAPRDC